MDILLIFIGLIAVVIGSAVGGFVAVLLVQGYGYTNLNFKLQRIENKIASAQGVEVKAEKGQRMQAALIEAAQIMKDENIPKEEKTKALMGLAAKYPDVAMDLVKKVGINGLL